MYVYYYDDDDCDLYYDWHCPDCGGCGEYYVYGLGWVVCKWCDGWGY